jgi:hypothetical protein
LLGQRILLELVWVATGQKRCNGAGWGNALCPFQKRRTGSMSTVDGVRFISGAKYVL